MNGPATRTLVLLSSDGTTSRKKPIGITLTEIRESFPATDYVGNQHYVFNIRGNNYRLVVVIKFTIGRIFVRFVGTHSEYDKIDCSTI